jgi:hypothetical protein
MMVQSGSTVEGDHRNRIWFFPDKFWRATKEMPADEAAELMEKVEALAAAGNLQELRKYPFVFVGDPYKRTKISA